MILITLCIFFNDTATTEIYTLSLHDALPISGEIMLTPALFTSTSARPKRSVTASTIPRTASSSETSPGRERARSEEHTSELQSRQYLVCRLLLEKKNKELRLNHAHLETRRIS